jgi:hypothetical protein
MARNTKYADHDLAAIAGLTDSDRGSFCEKNLNSREYSEGYDDDDNDDDDSGMSPSSSSYQGSYRRNNKDDTATEGGAMKIAQRENQAVRASKMVVMSVLVFITITASIGVFIYVDSNEKADMRSNFQEDASKVFSDVGAAIVQRFAQLDGMVVAMISYANLTGSVWPLVTVSDYAIRASKARSISGAIAIESFPYVGDVNGKEAEGQDRKSWETYSNQNGNDWVIRSLAVQSVDESYHGQQMPDEFVSVEPTGIWYGDEIVPPGSGP